MDSKKYFIKAKQIIRAYRNHWSVGDDMIDRMELCAAKYGRFIHEVIHTDLFAKDLAKQLQSEGWLND